MMSNRSKSTSKFPMNSLSNSLARNHSTIQNKSTDSQWQVLSMGFEEIYSFNSSNLSFEELYRNGYKMVVAKDGDKLYKNTKAIIQLHLEKMVSEKIAPASPPFLLQSSAEPSGSGLGVGSSAKEIRASNDELELFLKAFNNVWKDHLIISNMIKDVLMYLDRTFLPPRNLPSIFDTSIDLFREFVIHSKSHSVKNNLISALICMINNARDGGLVNKQLLSDTFRILASIPVSSVHAKSNNLFDSLFEADFLKASEKYYQSESQILIEPLSTKEYLERTKRRLEQESQLMTDLDLTKTYSKLKIVVEMELIGAFIPSIIQKPDSGLSFMIANDLYADMALMYNLLGLVPQGHSQLKQAVAEQVKMLGRDLYISDQPSTFIPTGTVNQTTTTTTTDSKSVPPFIAWIEKALQLKLKFHKVLEKCFQNDISFEGEINIALQSIIALHPKNSEFISLYLDHHLRSVSKGKLDLNEFEVIGENAISVFQYLSEKDIFERYYKQHLAKRLLYVKSISEDAEKGILGKLKLECGYQFTSKLEGMFTDSRLSLELSSEFQEYSNLKKEEQLAHVKNPEVSFNILTSTYWPFTTLEGTCILPLELQTIVNQFEAFYLSKHSGRRLTWLKNMGTADVLARFSSQSKRKELGMSTFCMIILITCFNQEQNEPVTFEQVKKMTGIVSEEAKRALLSLSLGKYRVLMKLSKGKEVSEQDGFKVNTEFTHSLSKIKILTISSSLSGSVGSSAEDTKERIATLEKIAIDRRYQIEASIVRIMKSRKSMQHNLLVTQVVEQLSIRFKPDILMIKKRIEELIERDYLERDGSDRNLYHYVA